MMWIAGILLIFAGVILAIAAWIAARYTRLRSDFPNPSYKEAQLRPKVQSFLADDVSVTWIGHSTLYINLFGIRILTDPVFSEKVGVSVARLATVGPKRYTGPAVTLEDVGPVDVVLLSHAHLDHFDLPSLRQIASGQTEVVTAEATSRLLRRLPFHRVHEAHHDQVLQLQNGLKVLPVPVRHWGRRYPWNKDYGWTGYLLEYRGVRLFFAGDTAYTPDFQRLVEHGPIDLAFIPIGAYAPDNFQRSHCTPEQAWQMFLDSGAKRLVPIHWNTFVLSKEPVDEPLQRLLTAAGDAADRIVLREPGAVFRLSEDQ